jgi:hypothetical protein
MLGTIEDLDEIQFVRDKFERIQNNASPAGMEIESNDVATIRLQNVTRAVLHHWLTNINLFHRWSGNKTKPLLATALVLIGIQ